MMSPGISRARIFSKRVLLIKVKSVALGKTNASRLPDVFRLSHHQSARGAAFVCAQAIAQILDDSIIQCLATIAPAFHSQKLFHAVSQSAKSHEIRSPAKPSVQLCSDAGEKVQFKTTGRSSG